MPPCLPVTLPRELCPSLSLPPSTVPVPQPHTSCLPPSHKRRIGLALESLWKLLVLGWNADLTGSIFKAHLSAYLRPGYLPWRASAVHLSADSDT